MFDLMQESNINHQPSTIMRALLKDLLSRPSVTPDDAGCQTVIAERLAAAGFEVEMMPMGGVTNLWATHGSGAPLICLAGHTDVVPPGEGWTNPPFEPTERDGYLYARGAADMKASVAAMVVALEQVAAEGHDGTIALLLTSDEEGPGVFGTKAVLEELAKRETRIHQALVGEPTSEKEFGDTIKVGRRGSLSGRLIVNGVQGHTAYPQLADNAAHRLAPLLVKLVDLDWGSGTEDFPPTTLQVSNLVSGTGAGNVIPGRAEVRFNVRFGTDWTPEAIQQRIEKALDSEIGWSVSALPFVTPPGSLREKLRTAVREVTSVEPKDSTGGGTSDARFFAAHGIPVAEFGPINATIHAVDERVAVAELEPLVEIYRLFLK